MPNPISNTYRPEQVSAPGETLQEILEDRRMSQAELAARAGRPKKTINEIIKGKAAITPETALQLERVLGVSASFWNNLERNYRESLARERDDELLDAATPWLKQLPIQQLVKLGWIARRTDRVSQLKELLRFFGVASPAEWEDVFRAPQAAFRHSPSFKSAPGALAAWLRKGELVGHATPCEPFDKAKFLAVLEQARSLTREEPQIFVPRLVELCSRVGVAVAFVPELQRCRAHGATRWISPSKALIQLSLRYKTNDHLWFTFFHEAGHLILHGKRLIFIEGGGANSTAEEEQANRFAADFLIPPDALGSLRQLVKSRRLSETNVSQFAQGLGIAPGIVVGRLQHEGWLPHTHLNGLKVRFAWAAST